MSRFERRLERYVGDLLRNRRPRRFRADPEELAALRTAAALRAAGSGTDQPDTRFVERLGGRLREELSAEPASEAGAAPARWRPAPSRRGLLVGSGALAASAALGAMAGRMVLGPATPGAEEGRVLVPNQGRWTPVAALSAVPDGSSLRFATGTFNGYLVNQGGRITALSAVCTHLGCTLSPDDPDRRLVCPCHRTSFDWSGAVQDHSLSYTPPPLPRLRVRFVEGVIQVLV